MRKRRGKDHHWEIRKYRGDLALYAHCKCGFYYACSSSKRKEDGSFSFEQEITNLYSYCPYCGAYKKWYNPEPKKIESFNWPLN